MDVGEANKDEFEVFVWGTHIAEDFMISRWSVTKQISHETVDHLKKLGYKAKVVIPSPGFGAVGGWISMLIDGINPLLPTVLRIGVLALKVVSDKYNRHMLNLSAKNRPRMTINVSYKSNSKGWVSSWDPDNISHKIDSMIDAAHFAATYLAREYPNIVFSQNIEAHFINGEASVTYSFGSGEDTPLNIVRYKKTARQSPIEKYISKSFGVTKLGLIRRTDIYANRLFRKSKVYYFVIPTILMKDLIYRYQVIKEKVKNHGNN